MSRLHHHLCERGAAAYFLCQRLCGMEQHEGDREIVLQLQRGL